MRIVLRGASYELQDERPVLERLVHADDVRGLIVAPNTDTPHAQDVVQWLAECGTPSVLVERDAVLLPGRQPRRVGDHRPRPRRRARRAPPRLARPPQGRPRSSRATPRPPARSRPAGRRPAPNSASPRPITSSRCCPPRTSPDFSAVVDATLDSALGTGVTALARALRPRGDGVRRPRAQPRHLGARRPVGDRLRRRGRRAVHPGAHRRQPAARRRSVEAAVDLLARRLEDPTAPCTASC